MDEFIELLEYVKLILIRLIHFGETMKYTYQSLSPEAKMTLLPAIKEYNDMGEELKRKLPRGFESQEKHDT